jgi:hypothetical protein
VYPTYEHLVLLIFGVTLGGFLFLASALIFLLEEATRFFVHFLGESTLHAWERLSNHAKHLEGIRSVSHSAKP